MTTDRPRANLDDFTIHVANHDQQIQHAKAGWIHWKKDNTFERYWDMYRKEREESPWGNNGKMLTWVLVRKDDIEGEIYAACETYQRKGFIKQKGSDSVEDTHLYGIASVVTPQQHLRNGYATRLLSLLHSRLSNLPPPSFDALPDKSESSSSEICIPKACGSILWSDVGSKFYSKCSPDSDRQGWVVDDHQVTELVWKILPTSGSEQLEKVWEWIYLSDLSSINHTLSQGAKENLRKVDTSERSVYIHDPASEGTTSFIPLKGTWQRPLIMNPEPIGLKYKSDIQGQEEEETIILFSLRTINIGDRLLITYIHNLKSERLPSVLKALDIIGRKANQEEGWIWGLNASNDDELIKTWQDDSKGERQVKFGRRKEIDGHLLGVAWYGDKEDKGELVDGQMYTWM
ncbi:uncharacterized protein L201_005787 [Kwoniella dendrophila CBS 6074]|uniref:SET domain-containing protein n=1 Tax=Kwoniella dendrophila CBS 6074 TaxID=1295534 RepID=A0AAX4JZP5_9TREE